MLAEMVISVIRNDIKINEKMLSIEWKMKKQILRQYLQVYR